MYACESYNFSIFKALPHIARRPKAGGGLRITRKCNTASL
ncbi:MAG: hypothetical protein ACI8W8_003244 [Rhodothermales bacterium]